MAYFPFTIEKKDTHSFLCFTFLALVPKSRDFILVIQHLSSLFGRKVV